MNCTHNYSRGTEYAEDLREVCPKQGCSEKIRKKYVVMTAGRWSSWSIQIPQFLMLWWPSMKAGSTAMTMHQSTTPSLSQTIWPRWASRQLLIFPIVQTLPLVTFNYSLSSRKNLEAVVMRQLRRWKRLWRRSFTRSHKRTSLGPSRSCWNGTPSALFIIKKLI